MPYTADSKDLPEPVKNMTARNRRRWAGVWNSAYEKCQKDGKGDCEAVAFRTANGTVKPREASDNPDDYLVVEDPEEKSTWHLQVMDDGKPNHRLMGAALAALGKGYRGNKYEGKLKGAALSKLKKLYKDEDMEMPAESAEVTEMDHGMTYVPSGITSFVDLQAAEEVYEATEEMQMRVNQFQQLAWNIFYTPDIQDKIGALRGLVDEFAALMGGATASMSGAELAEAVTVKALAKGALRSLSALLEDKSIPDSLRGKIDELKGALKKNWADLDTDAKDEWGKGKTEELAECKLSESIDGAALLIEADTGTPDLVRMDVRLIRPGWGNTKDNHYYAAETLSASADKFADIKMYETDHRPSEKSTRTWVSTVEGARPADDGSLVGKVVVHDPSFAQRVRNLKAADKLGLMECSILADGMARANYQEGGRKGKFIESISKVDSVDWVTRAGAGGAAMNLSESADGNGDNQMEEKPKVEIIPVETVETENTPVVPVIVAETLPESSTAPVIPAKVTIERVTEMLLATRLPKPAAARLQEREWSDEPALTKAIEDEIAYIKELTGSGKPFAQGESAATQPARMSEADRNKALDAVDSRFGIVH